MPTYRSEAEREVRDAVIARLRGFRPDARILHEINIDGGKNRVDLLAVSPAEIIAVEIKSSRDKLDRLADQVKSMRGVAHHVIAAIHEKHLVEHETNRGAAHLVRDGVFYRRDLPKPFDHGIGAELWAYPERRRVMAEGGHDFLCPWREPSLSPQTTLPANALNVLWRNELEQLCHDLGLSVTRRATMPFLQATLRWGATGRQITHGICAALRARKSLEADPPIDQRVAGLGL